MTAREAYEKAYRLERERWRLGQERVSHFKLAPTIRRAERLNYDERLALLHDERVSWSVLRAAWRTHESITLPPLTADVDLHRRISEREPGTFARHQRLRQGWRRFLRPGDHFKDPDSRRRAKRLQRVLDRNATQTKVAN